jgi:hypothetical protein
MSSTDRLSDEEAFEQGFHGIPDPQKRAKMSPERLAIELSKQEKDSPPYILLEHELNLRLAKEQANATLLAGRFGGIAAIVAALLTAVLGYFVGSSQSNQNSREVNTCPASTCNYTQNFTPPSPAKNEQQAPGNANSKINPKP